ncbi:syntaxin binding protein 1, partial [Spiromyces aspiralis]
MSGTTGELSLTELRRNEFVTAFQNVKAKHDYKVLVMDARSIKILKTMLNTGELAETRIVRFEKLGNYREPAQDKDVIYFLTPSPQSIREVITDFTPGPNNPTGKRYGFAHLYFTSALNGALFEMVKASSAIGHIGTLTELCIEYETFDQKVFLAQLANCPLYRIYSPFKLNNNASEFDLMAKKIVNVCDALNIVPVVRYFNPPEEFVPDCKARPLARMVEDEVRRRSGGPSSSSINRARRLGKPE